MTRTVHAIAMGALFIGGTSMIAAADETGGMEPPRPAITVRIYDYAGVPESIAGRARAATGRTFRMAGITADWAVCPISAQTMPGDPKCHVRPGPCDIRLNILTPEMAQKTRTDRRAFGAAYPLRYGFGRLAVVFRDRVKELATTKGASEGLLLGHVIAHEIGHLLLGVNSHSRAGIMRVPWNHAQIERAYLGTLLFAPADAERIRNQATARFEARQSQPDVRSPHTAAATHVSPRNGTQNAEWSVISAASRAPRPTPATVAAAADYR